MARLLDTPPGTTTEADEDDAIELSFEIVLLVVVVVGVPGNSMASLAFHRLS